MELKEKIEKELKELSPKLGLRKQYMDSWRWGFRTGFRRGYTLAYEEATGMLKEIKQELKKP